MVKRVAKEELESESWLKLVAQLNGRSYEEMRVIVLEFLDTDVFNISAENCISFLDPLIDSWDIDLTELWDRDRAKSKTGPRAPQETRVCGNGI